MIMNYDTSWMVIVFFIGLAVLIYYIIDEFRKPDNPLCVSSSRFNKKAYDKQVKRSEKAFLSGISKAKDDDQILKLLKKRLLDVLELRELYETTHATSKGELYRESSVISHSIEKIMKHNDNSELIHYCALVLDDFDKDRGYKYGLYDEKIYKTRYIYGAVQSIVEYEINCIETVREGFLPRVKKEKEKIEVELHQQYKQKK